MATQSVHVAPVLLDAIADALERDDRSALGDLQRQLVAAIRPAIEPFVAYVEQNSPIRVDRRPRPDDDDIDRCFARWIDGDDEPIHSLLARCTPERTVRRCRDAATNAPTGRAVRARLRGSESPFAALLTEALGAGGSAAFERLELARWLAAVEWQRSVAHVPASAGDAPAPAGASDASIAASRLVALRSPGAPLSIWDPLAVAERAVLGVYDEAANGPLVRTDAPAPWRIAVRRALTLTATRAQEWIVAYPERAGRERAAAPARLLAFRPLAPAEWSRAIAAALCDALDGNPARDDASAELTVASSVEPAVHGADRALIELLLGQRAALRSLNASAVDPLAFASAIEASGAAFDAHDALELIARANLASNEPRSVRASLRCARLLTQSNAVDRAPIEPIAKRMAQWLPTAHNLALEGLIGREHIEALLRDAESLQAVLPEGLAARSTIAAAVAQVRAESEAE